MKSDPRRPFLRSGLALLTSVGALVACAAQVSPDRPSGGAAYNPIACSPETLAPREWEFDPREGEVFRIDGDEHFYHLNVPAGAVRTPQPQRLRARLEPRSSGMGVDARITDLSGRDIPREWYASPVKLKMSMAGCTYRRKSGVWVARWDAATSSWEPVDQDFYLFYPSHIAARLDHLSQYALAEP